MPVKVSVVMATYNSGDRFLSSARSVLAQSLPPDEYELVVVDDGSTDGTHDRALALAAEHPQVVVDRIPNSGWPGRPRNIGTRLATGEYVLYMDHDDDLMPEALERAYAYASEHRADVLLAKEAVLGGATPGWDTYRHSVPCVERVDQRVLQSLTPHKFYRRQFVLDRGVAFPEGRVRLEDYDFNAQAYVRAERIAIFADYACYRWVHHDANAHNAGMNSDSYWSSFDHSLLAPERELPPGPDQDEYLVRWYRSRVLGRLGRTFRTYPEHRREQWWEGFRTSLRHFPEHLDARLPARHRLRSYLLRAGDHGRLLELAAVDPARLEARADAVAWSDGALGVAARAEAVRPDGSPLTFVRRGERVLRHLPDSLVADVPDEVLEVGEALASVRVELSVRGRTSGVEWPVPSEGTVALVDGPDGRLQLDLRVTGRLDPATAAAGSPLPDEVWNLLLRLTAFGYDMSVPVPAAGPRPLPALVDGRPVTAFRTRSGNVALDVGGVRRSLVDDARPRQRDVAWQGAAGERLVVRLPKVHVRGDADVPAELLLPDSDLRVPARLVAGDGRARVVGGLPRTVPPGARLEPVVGTSPSRTELVLPVRPTAPAGSRAALLVRRVGHLVPRLAALVRRR